MPSRIIRSSGGSQNLIDCLTSFFAMEAVKPSNEIYIISPWISNSPIIDNSHNRFVDIFPFIESNRVCLGDILKIYAWKGSKVRLICDPNHKSTNEFISYLGDVAECRVLKANHEKGMITNNFYLHGSMNFTYNGIHINGEKIRVVTEKPEINSALISAEARWEESEKL